MSKEEKLKRLEELKQKKSKTRLDAKEFAEFKKLSKELEVMGKERFVPGNDYSWWSKEQHIIKDAVNLLANSIAGTPVFGATSANTARLPGVMRLTMVNVYGSELRNTDPLNLQFRDLFLRMFQKYRGITAYQYSDLAIVMIATIEIVVMVARLERIYGIINYYDKLNLNVPNTLLGAMGLSLTDADYIRTHLSDFRYDLNTLIRKAVRLCIPKDMSIIADKISLYSYIYADHDSTRAQMYVFDTPYAGRFDETTLSTGSAIEFKDATKVVSPNGTYDSFAFIQLCDPNLSMFPALENMIEVLVGSDSANKIYADLTVWFGSEAMLTLIPLGEEYKVVPVYSESILHKIHNLDIYASNGVSTGLSSVSTPCSVITTSSLTATDVTTIGTNYWIYQNSRGTVCTTISLTEDIGDGIESVIYRNEAVDACSCQSVEIGLAGLKEFGRVIDSYHQNFSDEIVCEGSLFKCVVTKLTDPNNNEVAVVSSAVAEVCVGASIIGLSGGLVPFKVEEYSVGNAIEFAARAASFDWSPMIYSQLDPNGQVVDLIADIYGDIDTYRSVSSNELSRIHNAATLSGFKTDVVVVNK